MWEFEVMLVEATTSKYTINSYHTTSLEIVRKYSKASKAKSFIANVCP